MFGGFPLSSPALEEALNPLHDLLWDKLNIGWVTATIRPLETAFQDLALLVVK